MVAADDGKVADVLSVEAVARLIEARRDVSPFVPFCLVHLDEALSDLLERGSMRLPRHDGASVSIALRHQVDTLPDHAAEFHRLIASLVHSHEVDKPSAISRSSLGAYRFGKRSQNVHVLRPALPTDKNRARPSLCLRHLLAH